MGYTNRLVSYISEISPPEVRGRLVSIPQFGISLGVVVGYFMSYGSVNISSSLSWRLPFAVMSFIAFLYATSTLMFLPHSPRWLTAKGRHAEATMVWDKLGVSAADREEEENLEVNVEELMTGVELTPQMSTAVSVKEHVNMLLRVFEKDVWRRTALGMFLSGMQQLSGIDGVLYVSLITKFHFWALPSPCLKTSFL
jgi:MFS family permease